MINMKILITVMFSLLIAAVMTDFSGSGRIITSTKVNKTRRSISPEDPVAFQMNMPFLSFGNISQTMVIKDQTNSPKTLTFSFTFTPIIIRSLLTPRKMKSIDLVQQITSQISLRIG